jgi:hypothetical protein
VRLFAPSNRDKLTDALADLTGRSGKATPDTTIRGRFAGMAARPERTKVLASIVPVLMVAGKHDSRATIPCARPRCPPGALLFLGGRHQAYLGSRAHTPDRVALAAVLAKHR